MRAYNIIISILLAILIVILIYLVSEFESVEVDPIGDPWSDGIGQWTLANFICNNHDCFNDDSTKQ